MVRLTFGKKSKNSKKFSIELQITQTIDLIKLHNPVKFGSLISSFKCTGFFTRFARRVSKRKPTLRRTAVKDRTMTEARKLVNVL